MIALFVGRFQPLHKGHVYVIKKILKKYDKVIILIGSIQEKRTEENPLSFHERRKLLENVFREEIERGKIEIHGVKDVNNDELWSKKILKRYKFDVVVTGNKRVAKCFEGKKKVEFLKLKKPEELSASNIRRLIRKGNKKWKKLVPKETVEILENWVRLFDNKNKSISKIKRRKSD